MALVWRAVEEVETSQIKEFKGPLGPLRSVSCGGSSRLVEGGVRTGVLKTAIDQGLVWDQRFVGRLRRIEGVAPVKGLEH